MRPVLITAIRVSRCRNYLMSNLKHSLPSIHHNCFYNGVPVNSYRLITEFMYNSSTHISTNLLIFPLQFYHRSSHGASRGEVIMCATHILLVYSLCTYRVVLPPHNIPSRVHGEYWSIVFMIRCTSCSNHMHRGSIKVLNLILCRENRYSNIYPI